MSLRILKVIFLLSFFGCSTSRQSGHTNSIVSNIDKDNLYFPKVSLRIESNGQLRSHRVSLAFFSDTLIHFSISSGFNRQIATVIFDNRGMQFYDLYSKSGFYISEKEFNDEFGISNFPQTVKSLLLGYPIDGSGKILATEKKYWSSDNTSILHDEATNMINSINITSLISDNSILTRYLWLPTSNRNFPRSTYITINLKDDVYEFDLEYDHKSFTTATPPITEEDLYDLLTNYTFKND